MRRHGFTLMELLVVISIIALLAGMILGAVSIVRRQAREVQCRSNLQQIGIGLTGFQQDHNNSFPVTFGALFAQGSTLEHENSKILLCPLDPDHGTNSLMGRANNNSNSWGDLSALFEPGCSYLFEASGRTLGATERDWTYPDNSSWKDHGNTWAEAKAYQLKHGNAIAGGNAPFRPSDFPIVRCWHHAKWADSDMKKADKKKVMNLAWDLSIFMSIPYWEHQINPAIPLP
jgi:prepilin-type N-terminal cleavage/methylation domain-containing protein